MGEIFTAIFGMAMIIAALHVAPVPVHLIRFGVATFRRQNFKLFNKKNYGVSAAWTIGIWIAGWALIYVGFIIYWIVS